MKSKKSQIHKNMRVRSELKPAIGLLDPKFVYQRESNLRERFQLIRERQASDAAEAAKAHDANVLPIHKKEKSNGR